MTHLNFTQMLRICPTGHLIRIKRKPCEVSESDYNDETFAEWVAVEDVKKFIKSWGWGADECLDEILKELSEVENGYKENNN